MSIIPTILLAVASPATVARVATVTPSLDLVSDSISSAELGSGSGIGFIGTEIDEKGGVHDSVSADAVAASIQSSLPNPYADIFPGSISTNPSNPQNPYNTTSSSSDNAPSQSPSSAVLGILCVALVFSIILILVGIWQLKERRDAKRFSQSSTGQFDVEIGIDVNTIEKANAQDSNTQGGDITDEKKIITENTIEENNRGVGGAEGGGVLEANFVTEGFLGPGDFAGKYQVLGKDGKMVRLGNEVVVAGVVGERVLRIL